MKFFGFLATLAVATTAAFGQYCGSACDSSKIPTTTLSAPLTLVAVVDKNNPNVKYQIGGNVIITDDCHFTVENFYITPGSLSAKWMGARIGSSEGMNLSTDSAVTTIDPNQPQTVTYDVSNVNPFCKVSLLNDVGRISLVDSDYQLLAYADVNPNLKADGSTNSGNGSASGTASNANSNGKPNGNASSDATTAKWSMGLLGLSSIIAILLA